MFHAIFAIAHSYEKNYPSLVNKRLLVFFYIFSGPDFLLTGLFYNSVGAEVNL